ncbi:MAG: DUF488 family protein [Thermoplasmatota archaeon]
MTSDIVSMSFVIQIIEEILFNAFVSITENENQKYFIYMFQYGDVKKIYTIGYQGKSIDELIELLRKHRIQHLVDVRSLPRSQMDDFNKEKLKESLFYKGIYYKHIPELGGLIDIDYREKMKTKEWQIAYNDLKELAVEGKTVIMCMERDPMKCHRRFIAEKLEDDGFEVVHMGKGGSWKEKRLEDF